MTRRRVDDVVEGNSLAPPPAIPCSQVDVHRRPVRLLDRFAALPRVRLEVGAARLAVIDAQSVLVLRRHARALVGLRFAERTEAAAVSPLRRTAAATEEALPARVGAGEPGH